MPRVDAQRLTQVTSDIGNWVSAAQWVRFLAWHQPLPNHIELNAEESEAVARLLREELSSDLAVVTQRARWTLFAKKADRTLVDEAQQRLEDMRHAVRSHGHDQLIHSLQRRLEQSRPTQLDGLRTLLAQCFYAIEAATESRQLSLHMPLTRNDLLDADESLHIDSVHALATHHRAAARLLHDDLCAQGECVESHRAISLLTSADVRSLVASTVARTARDRLNRQRAEELLALGGFHRRTQLWLGLVSQARKHYADAHAMVEAGTAQLRAAGRSARFSEGEAHFYPLTAPDTSLARSLFLTAVHPLSLEDESRFRSVEATARETDSQMAHLSGIERKCPVHYQCIPVHDRLAVLFRASHEVGTWVAAFDADPVPSGTSIDDLTDPRLGLARLLGRPATRLDVLSPETTGAVLSCLPIVVDHQRHQTKALKTAKAAARAVREHDVAVTLRAMDLESLKKAAMGKSIRLAALRNAGLNTVWDVHRHNAESLSRLPGFGPDSSRVVVSAALRLHDAVRDDTPVRIDVRARATHTVALLEALRDWERIRSYEPLPDELALASALAGFTGTPPQRIMVALPPSAPPAQDLVASLLDRLPPRAGGLDIWTDFLSRPATYFGMLTELGFMTEDEKKMHGDLPEEIVRAVRGVELRTDRLKASLRAYQAFGTRFAIAQEKVVIGDEMGLGKTLQGLSLFAHLASGGETHFLVVCPAAVVSNWMRETSKHTQLIAHRIHGPMGHRLAAIRSWQRRGGVAVTTYGMLDSHRSEFGGLEISAIVVDEAHYIKNPRTQRGAAVSTLLDRVRYAVLLTGTPLENRVDEFRNIIGYVRADLAASAPEYLATLFKKHVAPAYLRRNQEDVLTELPELVSTEEWLDLSPQDEQLYRRAVADGNFMAMRRAAMLSKESAKMHRLEEIVTEAGDNGRRVIVFSYFHEVLARVKDVLGPAAIGPVTGRVAAADRQRLVDEFTDAPSGAVLLAQVVAGGVGLNIQAASVVILCEPQVKPTLEAQAIARAHRMGQVHTVQVHRLLTEDGVDERLREILAVKQQLFDEFARDSAIVTAAPESTDISDSELAKMIVQAERERLLDTTSVASSG